jgi:hypothetical protein
MNPVEGDAILNSNPLTPGVAVAARPSVDASPTVVLQVSNADKFVAERLSCVLRLPN